MIDFRCGCGRAFRVPEAMAGRRARCGSCRALLDIPAYVPTPVLAPVPAPAWRWWRDPVPMTPWRRVLAIAEILLTLSAGYWLGVRSGGPASRPPAVFAPAAPNPAALPIGFPGVDLP